MSIAHVFRSIHPDLLAARDAWLVERAAFGEKVAALRARHGINGKGYQVLGDRKVDRLVGFIAEGSQRGNPPAGWKYSAKHNALSPYRRTKAEKAVALEFDSLTCTSHRGALVGMPPECFGCLPTVHRPGIEEHGGFIYVMWGDCKSMQDKVDADIWEPVRLSEFYAAREADEETEVAS